MNRDTVKACRELVGEIDDALSDLPWRLAMPAKGKLSELCAVIEEELPGGLYGVCDNCEELIANGDPQPATGEDGGCMICDACCKRWDESAPDLSKETA